MSDCHLGRIRAEWLVAFIVGAWFMSGVNVANGSVSENVQKDSAIHRPEVPEHFETPRLTPSKVMQRPHPHPKDLTLHLPGRCDPPGAI